MAIVILESFDDSEPIATQEYSGDFVATTLEPSSSEDNSTISI